MVEGIFSRNFTLLERAMDVRVARQQLLSSAIANIDTPGFRALDVDFEASLKSLMDHEDAMAEIERGLRVDEKPLFEADSDKPSLKITGMDGMLIGPDSNSANLELVMGKMSENSLMFQIAAQLIQARFQGLRGAIEGAGRV